ncbi:ABC transporter ATP-binding protein YxdL [compost metagenome]
MRTLAGLNRDRQVTIVMVTHDPFAASYCSRVVFIKDGGIGLEISREQGAARKTFFGTILDSLAFIGGGEDDF